MNNQFSQNSPQLDAFKRSVFFYPCSITRGGIHLKEEHFVDNYKMKGLWMQL